MTENKLYCDICQKQIYRHHMWYKLRRRMFEYDIFGEKRQLDICEDCYCLIVEMARSKEAHHEPVHHLDLQRTKG